MIKVNLPEQIPQLLYLFLWQLGGDVGGSQFFDLLDELDITFENLL